MMSEIKAGLARPSRNPYTIVRPNICAYLFEKAIANVHIATKPSETRNNHFRFSFSASIPAQKLDSKSGTITAVPEIVEKFTVSPITVPIQ